MINYIKSDSPIVGTEALAQRISSALCQNKSVLWLICGGSNLPIAVDVLESVRESVTNDQLLNLTVSQTDERYGPVGHPDSNWHQLLDLGFNLNGFKYFPILKDLPLKETALDFGRTLEELLGKSDLVIGQFGLGADGHIAGILPNSPAVNEAAPVCGYESQPFTRVTITFPVFEKIQAAYAFVFGSNKREAVERLRDESRQYSLSEAPAVILKKMKEAHFYSDLVE